MKMRRTRALWLVAALVAVGLAPAGVRAQAIPVTVGGNASSLVGVDFELPVIVDMSARTEKLGSFALRVQWNPNVFQMLGVHDGTFGSITLNEDSLAAGVLIASGVNPSGVGGRITLLTARMRPLLADTTTVAVSVTELFAAATFVDLSADASVSSGFYCPAFGRYGDIDGDGAANSRDALIALSAAVGLDVSSFNESLGDVDGDGATKARDALIILSNAVGLDVTAFRVFFVAPGACATAPTVPGITIEPGDLTVLEGQRVAYAATVSDSSGSATALTDVFWQTSDEAVATVTPDGLVTALGAGSVVISALRQSTSDSAGVTLTVVAGRGTHWVDALAADATNRLGTATYPFATIPDAVTVAGEADTVQVRMGRYAPEVSVGKSLVIVGEVLAGQMPLIGATTTSASSGFAIGSGARRVEVHNFDLDSLYYGVQTRGADTVLVRNIRHSRNSGHYYGGYGVYAREVDLIRIENSSFEICEYGRGFYGYDVNVASIDSTSFSTRAGEYYFNGAVYLSRADSLHVSGSRFLTTPPTEEDYYYEYPSVEVHGGADGARTAVVFSENRFEGAGVIASGYRSVRFDHNVFRRREHGDYYSYQPLIDLWGEAYNSLVTFRGDSIHNVGSYYYDYYYYGSPWLDLSGYDSLAVDSLWVRSDYDGYGAEVYHGRTATVTDSRFEMLGWGSGIRFYGASVDSTQVQIQNTAFVGPDSTECDRCGTAVDVDYATVDANNVTATNFYRAFETDNGRLSVRNSSFTHNYYDIESWNSPITVSNVSSHDAQYSVDTYGRRSLDTLVVDGSSFTQSYRAVYADEVPTTITNNVFTDSRYGVSVYYDDLVATDNEFVHPEYHAIEFYGDSGTVANVARNTATCDESGAANVYAFIFYGSEMLITDNVVNGCHTGVYAYNELGIYDLPEPVPVEIRGNTITMPTPPGDYGLYVGGAASVVRAVGNTVSGPAAYGSINVSSYVPYAELDSNTIDGSIEAGIRAYYVDTLRVRDNVITNHGLSDCCLWEPSGAIQLAYQSSVGDTIWVSRNRITDSRASGIVVHAAAQPRLVMVDSNTVKRADSVGIWVAKYDYARLRWNAIDSTGLDAVRVSYLSSDTSVVAQYNNFTNSGIDAVSGGYGLRNSYGSYIVDATNNWWGDTLGPSGFYGDTTGASTGDSVSMSVMWDPWLTAPATAPTPAPIMIAAWPARVWSVAGRAAAPRTREVTPERRETVGRPQLTRHARTMPTLREPPAGIAVPPEILDAQRRRAERWLARFRLLERLDTERLQREAQRAERFDSLAAERVEQRRLVTERAGQPPRRSGVERRN